MILLFTIFKAISKIIVILIADYNIQIKIKITYKIHNFFLRKKEIFDFS